ncbi:MAG: beta-ketoacyl-ACP synthase II [Planctomycetes bacterium]|nr:beta-ketoacyl-ACP synthase II [Planctomycetota bacterium]
MSKRRVVVTGLGLVTPVGQGSEKVFGALLAGQSGIGRITHFDSDTPDWTVHIAGEVRDLDTGTLDPRALKRMDPFTLYAVVAAREALDDSGIVLDREDRTRIAVLMGTGIGGITELEHQCGVLREKSPRRVSPLTVPRMMFNAHTGMIALELGLLGPNYAIGSACASSNHAIGIAMRTIQYGDADVVFTGGSEAALTPVGVASFMTMKALSTRNDEPTRASRPFDKGRDGFVMGEGSGVLILEERERAIRRGARIYAELIGFGSSDDAHHITAPEETGEGMMRSMQLAIADARIAPDQIGYVNCHGTSTELNDKTECHALKRCFGDHARKLQISSTKSMVGHLLGASGAVELAVTCLSLHHGKLHPTINQDEPDPECDLDTIPNVARDARIDYAISNSFGFGGTNATLAIRRHDS